MNLFLQELLHIKDVFIIFSDYLVSLNVLFLSAEASVIKTKCT